ncbi:UNVERIFIED_CONTAM: hypothetical protein GTU68_012185 [Idotea baltica]|nr:hypothetical protein [Idotea baltica]
MSQVVHLRGEVQIPGDKSITHRACMFGAIAEGQTRIRTASMGRDNLATIRILRQLGVLFSQEGADILVEGVGLGAFKAPAAVCDCGNSGTTARLMTGLLASTGFEVTLTGDASLKSRPFARVTKPLTQMGVSFDSEMLPLSFKGEAIKGIRYHSPKASAQVKSAVILAGLSSTDQTQVVEPRRTRDHSEKMLQAMGVVLSSEAVEKDAWQKLTGIEIDIPGDFSAATFFLVAGSIFPDSDISLKGIGLNETRVGALHVLQRMGASIEISSERLSGGEPVADLQVCSASLKGVEIGHEDVVLGIDEIPILAVAAAIAEGKTVVTGAEELRVKESDRLSRMVEVLRSFGIEVEEADDGMTVSGAGERANASWRTSGDHRIAMSGAILEYFAAGDFQLQDAEAVETSFPGFVEQLRGLATSAS